MKTEKLLFKFKLPMIQDLTFVDHIVSYGYRKTGNKFWVNFNGSKGYLSNIDISCEGVQHPEDNRIFVERLRNKDRSLKSIMINVFHSEENGLRISMGKDEPRTITQIEASQPVMETVSEQDDNSDLPF